ncbi:hypothetical protein O163_02655 [Caldanaerobacter subterraneus subsp. yonseiensis KB-1]|uniref:Uncharacterized protein n=1 Tax=Caldanaerobacter subterraneus subsp. yonseiensis KB-1 TaxID=1388761 RepID=U5CT71_CALSX|nr:hypothetical protein O163_02655 [Caldanaerobacter subterraneus subsp. yonseiensis KB-1]
MIKWHFIVPRGWYRYINLYLFNIWENKDRETREEE